MKARSVQDDKVTCIQISLNTHAITPTIGSYENNNLNNKTKTGVSVCCFNVDSVGSVWF